jgi:hypothetical protein
MVRPRPAVGVGATGVRTSRRRQEEIMSYINVGQHGATTKKALQAAIVDDPASVQLYGTSDLGPQFEGETAADCPEGVTLLVVGPDPYGRRLWYATIENQGGKIVVR